MPRIGLQSNSIEYVYITLFYCAQRLVLKNSLYNNCFEEQKVRTKNNQPAYSTYILPHFIFRDTQIIFSHPKY